MDKRGVANPVFALVVVIVVAAFVYVAFVDNPFSRGAGVDFTYVYADGTQEVLETNSGVFTCYLDDSLTLYRDSSLTQQITGVQGSLWLKPDTGGGTETIEVNYTEVALTCSPNIGVITSSGPVTMDEIPAGTITRGLKTKTLSTSAFLSSATTGTYTVGWVYKGTGTIKGTSQTAAWNTTGTLTIYHKGTTLTITAGVDTSTFSIR